MTSYEWMDGRSYTKQHKERRIHYSRQHRGNAQHMNNEKMKRTFSDNKICDCMIVEENCTPTTIVI